jgi:hypothetical protein
MIVKQGGAMFARNIVRLLSSLVLASAVPAVLDAQASTAGPIRSLKFAIEEAVPVRTNDPIWITNGGAFVVPPGEKRNIRAAADGTGGRVYPSTTYRVVEGGDWFSLADPHPSMGTVRVDARAGVGAGRVGRIEWTLASGFQPSDGVTSGWFQVRSGGGASIPGASTLPGRSASAIVADLYRGILLREPDAGAQVFIDTVTREGWAGVERAASEIALSEESRTTVYQKGATNERRLEAMYLHLAGQSLASIPATDRNADMAELNRRGYDVVARRLLAINPGRMTPGVTF